MSSKWETAQKYEIMTWGLVRPDLEIVRHRSLFFSSLISRFLKKTSRILEIGGAGEPIINHFNSKKKYAMDPHIERYEKLFPSLYKSIKTKKGKAENIPFKDNFFDLVIMLNVLDHTESPNKCVLEAKRVIKKGGIFLFSVDVSGNFWKFITDIRKIIVGSVSSNQKLHIHHFTRSSIERILEKHFGIVLAFSVLKSNGEIIRKKIIKSPFKKIQGKEEMFFVLKK